jgi:glyoxylase-like metal-dependent hydrolase (beta-lactamase superfamily II)
VRCPSALLAAWLPLSACSGPGFADRLHVFEVGECRTTDVSRWSPGVDEGRPWVFANHCYLIRHGRDLLLWDTGFADGLSLSGDAIELRAGRPLAEQLAAIGLRPGDVTHLAFSHLHIDHAGNANLFADATLFLQRAEHAAAFGPEPHRYGFDPATYGRLQSSRTVLLDGDHDVFGDGSVVILATPGHTPGHQSLLVRLRSGALILSGDAAHMRSNWQYRRTPATNFDRQQSVRSMARIQEVLDRERATLVIQHERDQCLPKAPGFVE